MALRAGLDILHRSEERTRRVDYLAPALTLRTGRRAGARFRAGSVTGRAGILHRDIQLFAAALDRLIKCDAHTLADVAPAHRTCAGRASASGTAAEEIAENIAEDIREISALKIKSSEASRSAGTRLKGGMSELVILRSLLFVREHSISLRGFLKLSLGILVAGIHIRMVFLRQLAVCFFECGVVRIAVDA